MRLTHSAAVRLEAQLDAVQPLLERADPEAMTRRPRPDTWSAHENLAHLARYHEVFLERIGRILAEERPHLPRYRAEEDPSWPKWAAKPTGEVVQCLMALRADLIERVNTLSLNQLSRVGIHPTFGEMSIPMWIEFFLLHEAHHLYVIMTRTREASEHSASST